MAKDPAFLFYPNDWIGGTMGMKKEKKGAYMELLMLQFNRGHMNAHMIGQIVGQIWDGIKDKFIQDDEGNWYNDRLEVEKNKRKEFTISRRNNLSGNNQYTKKGGHMTTHMENEDVNSINSLNIEKNGAKKFSGNFKARGEEVLGNGYLERLKEAERLRKKDNSSEA